MNNQSVSYFKAFIRVVKSLQAQTDLFIRNTGFDSDNIVREPLIIAKDKAEVKQILVDKYPQFFQHGRIYERETADQAQFFYVVIFPLYQHEIDLMNEGNWTCSSCGQIHENKYMHRPKYNEKILGKDVMFCRSEDDVCMNRFIKEKYKDVDLRDDFNYIKVDSPNFIYKCTEKSTGKCYIGKTRNAPFFRWWNHLTHSHSPFGKYLRETKLSDWTFEVLEELPYSFSESEVMLIESKYILQYDSINNGFNSTISNKSALDLDALQDKIDEQLESETEESLTEFLNQNQNDNRANN